MSLEFSYNDLAPPVRARLVRRYIEESIRWNDQADEVRLDDLAYMDRRQGSNTASKQALEVLNVMIDRDQTWQGKVSRPVGSIMALALVGGLLLRLILRAWA